MCKKDSPTAFTAVKQGWGYAQTVNIFSSCDKGLCEQCKNLSVQVSATKLPHVHSQL